MSTNEPTLKSANLQDISITVDLPDLLGRSSPNYDVEYGTRVSDNALVFHFFPPGWAEGKERDWPDWTKFRDSLEQAILACFPVYEAGYVRELKSFFVILRAKPSVPDLNALLERFFSLLEV